MSFEFMDDARQLNNFLNSGVIGKSEKEIIDYNKAILKTKTSLTKIVNDIKHLEQVAESHNKTMKEQNNILEKSRKKNDALSGELVEQTKILEKLKKRNKKRVTEYSADKIKKQEEKVNNILKEQIKIKKELTSADKASNASTLRASGANTKLINANVEKEKLQSQLAGVVKAQELNSSAIGVKKKSSSIARDFTESVKSVGNFMFIMKSAFGPMADAVQNMANLEKSITSLGVVAGKSRYEIAGLRDDLLKMSTTSVYSAGQLSEAMEQVIRTGATYADAQMIVADATDLATASFESLSFATMTVNKAMVALKIDAENAGKIVNSFHNIVLSTPLDLRTLDESLRQTASAFGTVVEFSGKSGNDMEDYKLQVLDTVSALTGAMALMGKTGSQAGTSLKMFGTKLLAMTSAAGNMLDAEMLSKNVGLSRTAMESLGFSEEEMSKEVKMSTAMLTRLVKTDLDVALNEISSLYQTGDMSFETLSKMFGQRHVGQIATMLTMIGGDIGSFKTSLLSMRDVTEDAQVAMGSWAASLDMMKNSLTRFKGGINEFLDTGGKALLDFLSSTLNTMSDLNVKIPGMTSGLMAMGASALALAMIYKKLAFTATAAGVATTGLAKATSGLKLMMGSISLPVVGAIMAASIGVGLLVGKIAKERKESLAYKNKAISLDNQIGKTSQQIYISEMSRFNIHRTMLGKLDAEAKQWQKISGFIKDSAGNMEDFYGGMNANTMAIDMAGLSNKSYKEQAQEEYISKKRRDISTRIGIDPDDEGAKLERRKLRAAELSTRDTGDSGLARMAKAGIEMDVVKQTSQTSYEGQARASVINEELDNLREIIANDIPVGIKSALDTGVLTLGQLQKDMIMSTVDFQKANESIINELQGKIISINAKARGESRSTSDEENKEIALMSKQISARQLYYNARLEASEVAQDMREAELEIMKMEIDAMQKMKEAFEENLSKISQLQGSLMNSISKSKLGILKKENISNVDQLFAATERVGGKGASNILKEELSKIKIGGQSISGQDIMRATDGGKDLSMVSKTSAYSKAKKIQAEQGTRSSSQLIKSGKFTQEQLDIASKDFTGAETGIAQQKILDNLQSQLDISDQEGQAVASNLRYYLESIQTTKLLDEDYRLALMEKLQVTRRGIEVSDLQITNEHKDNMIYLSNLGKVRMDEEKMALSKLELDRKIEKAKEKEANAVTSNAIRMEEIFKRQGSSTIEKGEYAKMGIGGSTSEEFSSQLVGAFGNVSPEKIQELYGKEVAKFIMEDLAVARETLNAEQQAKEEIAKLENEKIELLRKENEANRSRKSELLDRYATAEKRKIKKSGGAFGSSTAIQENAVDRKVIAVKMTNLQNEIYANGISDKLEKELYDLKQKEIDLQEDVLDERQELYHKIAKMGIENLASGLFGDGVSWDNKASFSQGAGGLSKNVIKGMTSENGFQDISKAEMGIQGAQMGISMINSVTQAQADGRVKALKAEGDILAMRMEGVHTEEEKKELEEQIYENKKRQIREEYKAKTQFMGMSGTGAAALGGMTSGAMSGAMAGAAGGPTGMAAGAAIGGASGLIGGWMGGNKAKQEAKQAEATLKVQQDIKTLNEDRNKMLEANNTFMGQFGKTAGKIGIEEGLNAAFKSIADVGTMAIGGAGIETYTKTHGSGKKKYKTQESVQKTVGLSDIGMDRDTFDSLAETQKAVLKTEEKIAYWRKQGGYSASATLKAYENMLKNLKNIQNVHESNIAIYKSYFGAKLSEEKDGDYITGFSADWTDFRAELLKMSSGQALAGMEADIQKFTGNFFDGITDAFVQNSSELNNIISKSVIPAYELMADVLNNEFENMEQFNIAYGEALAKAQGQDETSKKHAINNDQVRKSMELLILASKQYKEEQQEVNKAVGEFEKTWIDAGGNISDILQSATQATKDLYSALRTSVESGSKSGLEALIGSDTIKGITDTNITTALDGLSKNIIDISAAASGGADNFDSMANALDEYLKLSDALGDFERYRDELIGLGMSEEEIANLEYQLKLQDLLNDKLEERMTLTDLLSSRQSSVETEIKKMITEISKAGGYENVDQIVKDRYQELIDELQGTSGDLKDATREFTKAWLDGTIDGVFDEVKSGLDENTRDLFDSVNSAFSQEDFASMGSEIGGSIASSILESYKDTLINGRYKEEIAMINQGMFDVVGGAEGGTLSILGSAQVAQSVQRLAVEMEQERQRMAAIESLFDYGRQINYDQTANQINYETSSSKESVYNVTNTNNFNVGNVIGKDFQMREFATAIAPFMERAFKNLGITMK